MPRCTPRPRPCTMRTSWSPAAAAALTYSSTTDRMSRGEKAWRSISASMGVRIGSPSSLVVVILGGPFHHRFRFSSASRTLSGTLPPFSADPKTTSRLRDDHRRDDVDHLARRYERERSQRSPGQGQGHRLPAVLRHWFDRTRGSPGAIVRCPSLLCERASRPPGFDRHALHSDTESANVAGVRAVCGASVHRRARPVAGRRGRDVRLLVLLDVEGLHGTARAPL